MSAIEKVVFGTVDVAIAVKVSRQTALNWANQMGLGTKNRLGWMEFTFKEYQQLCARKPISLKEAGKLGGSACRDNAPTGYYQQIGQMGGSENAQRHGPDYFKQLGSKGGRSCRARHGQEFYEQIGRTGGKKVQAAFAALRAQEAQERA
jgi:general stress protein YciG